MEKLDDESECVYQFRLNFQKISIIKAKFGGKTCFFGLIAPFCPEIVQICWIFVEIDGANVKDISC